MVNIFLIIATLGIIAWAIANKAGVKFSKLRRPASAQATVEQEENKQSVTFKKKVATRWDDNWTKSNVIPVVVMIIMINVAIAMLWPDQYSLLWKDYTGELILIAILIATAVSVFTPTGTMKRHLARVLIICSLIVTTKILLDSGIVKWSWNNQQNQGGPATLFAPVEDWSEPVSINYRKFLVDANGVVYVMVNGDPKRVEKSTKPDLGDGIHTLQFQSTGSERIAIKVTLK